MFNWIKKILDILLLPRSTIELGKLNGIWERFNNGEDIRNELRSYKWKYHQEKVDLLEKFINLTPNP